jgi:hypothetical protein
MPHTPYNPPPRRRSPLELARRLLESICVRGTDGGFHRAWITLEADLRVPPYVRTPEHLEAERRFGLGKVEYRLVSDLES